MRYLLDTNILSNAIKHPGGVVARRIADVGEREVLTSIIVAAELRFGAAKMRAPHLTAKVDAVLQTLDVAPFDTPADVIYGALRARLQSARTPIGANDMLIAAHAIALDCTVVTDNVHEFARVDGLRLENWLCAA